MREVVLDTETTGLDPNSGHRVVEIGCIELVNHIATGNHFQRYINPERDMPAEAFQIHGLSEAFLGTKPVFKDVADDFIAFIGESPLVIHNAEFDLKFLNAEFKRIGLPFIPAHRAVDTVHLARKKYPGERVNLDTLCRRFDIDNTARTKHGALLDSELLAEVYLELIGGRQPGFTLDNRGGGASVQLARPHRPPRPHAASDDEQAVHDAYLEDFVPDAIWKR